PVPRGGEGLQAVGAGRQLVAVDPDRRAELDRRVLVGARAPDLAVGDDLAPDLPALDAGTAVLDGDLGEPDRLRYGGVGARTGEVELLGQSGASSGGQQAKNRQGSQGSHFGVSYRDSQGYQFRRTGSARIASGPRRPPAGSSRGSSALHSFRALPHPLRVARV